MFCFAQLINKMWKKIFFLSSCFFVYGFIEANSHIIVVQFLNLFSVIGLFYTPVKHQKASGCLLFAGGLEIDSNVRLF